jgi:hypothetical protein
VIGTVGSQGSRVEEQSRRGGGGELVVVDETPWVVVLLMLMQCEIRWGVIDRGGSPRGGE